MTSKERMITAFRNLQPDMVPVAPDVSNMIPAKLTGKPFWDVYYYNDPPLEEAYVRAVEHFGFDGWSDKGRLTVILPDVTTEDKILERGEERLVVERTYRTPAGELREINERAVEAGYRAADGGGEVGER